MWEAFGERTLPIDRSRGGAEAAKTHETWANDVPASWQERLAGITFAFQPIVNIHSGMALGYEALLRGCEHAGWEAIPQLFDQAHREGVLREVSAALRERAIGTFATLPFASRARLFLNVDARELESWSSFIASIDAQLARHGLPPESVCLEVSERHPTRAFDSPWHAFTGAGARSHKVAIDDFGTGFSGLKLLYLAEPDYIKIDRFFIAGMAQDARKRLFVSSIVNIAHVLGTMVVAEGVETLAEYRECRAVGCDLVQGYFVQPPTCDTDQLRPEYSAVNDASRAERRNLNRDEQLITSRIEAIPAISLDMEMSEVLHFFRRESSLTFVPVVNHHREPVGIVRESDLREYAYSNYGKDLLRNPSLRAMLLRFVVRCPVADIQLPAERILESFSLDGGNEGILVVDNSIYVGFLSARSLLQIINEKNLLLARDQNPLTRLPGNTLIYQTFSTALQSGSQDCTVVYFDFDNFKPFNDTYGFRAGDRAIVLFAELFQKSMLRPGTFLGHIGGDDFFALVKEAPPATVLALVDDLIRAFARDVSSLYHEEDRQRGYIEARDRSGRVRRFSLLSVSAAVLYIPAGPPRSPLDGIVFKLAAMKRTAKAAPGNMCFAVLDEASRITIEVP